MDSITPPIAPQFTPVTELIEIMANIVEIGGISVITQDRVKNCETIVKRDFPNGITDFSDLEEKDIQDLVKFYESKRDSSERIAFGLTAIRRMKGLMHWVKDCRRRDMTVETPNITLAYINQSLINANERKIFRDQKEVNVTIANPGKFTKEKEWTKWQHSFVNYRSIILGQTGIPLSYIERFHHLPNYQRYPTYHLQLINQAPLTGRVFLADTSSMYQNLCSLTTSTPAEEWIKASNP